MSSKPANTRKYLVISALGQDRPGIVKNLSQAITEHECNIEDSRMAVLGGEFALMLLVSGSWSAIAKLEGQLPALGKKLELVTVARPTEGRVTRLNMVPYTVNVVAMDHPGIVRDVTDFFSTREINIEEMNTWTYPAAHTGTPMFSLSMTISIPANVQIARLRDDFLHFCDDLNLDATLEPVMR
jgi:glycine cleavage system transcriptional repressor